jgi:outer membrane immunogenic protein
MRAPQLAAASIIVAMNQTSLTRLRLFTASASTQLGSVSATRTGYVVGAGLEYGIARNWSVRGEYLYTAFSGQSAVQNNASFPTFTGQASAGLNVNIVRSGIDYRFNGPVVAKY